MGGDRPILQMGIQGTARLSRLQKVTQGGFGIHSMQQFPDLADPGWAGLGLVCCYHKLTYERFSPGADDF